MPAQQPVSTWVLEIAQDLVGVMKRADHKGTLEFLWAGKTLVRVEWPSGEAIRVTFPETDL
jgi:hypothetical protein